MRWFLLALVVLSTVAGDLLKAYGMRRHGEVREFHPGAWGRLLAALARNRHVALSIVAYAVSFFAFMALVSAAELSFAVPATAAGYVVETALARHVLRETVAWRRWAGAGLVAVGVVLVA